MKKTNDSKAKTTKTKPRKRLTVKKVIKKTAKPRRRPQAKLKKRKRGMKPVEMWVMAATLLLVVYLMTQVRTPAGMSFMAVMIEAVGHGGN